jgi:acyl-coenzyme A synthetase/AMP-(fatty) acid ligase
VAIGIPDRTTGTEKLVVIASIQPGMAKDNCKEIKQSIRRILFQNFGVTAEEVHLVKSGWITKTHNGKISRTAARTKYAAWKKENRFT